MESVAKYPFRRCLCLKAVKWLCWGQGSSRKTGRGCAREGLSVPHSLLCALSHLQPRVGQRGPGGWKEPGQRWLSLKSQPWREQRICSCSRHSFLRQGNQDWLRASYSQTQGAPYACEKVMMSLF